MEEERRVFLACALFLSEIFSPIPSDPNPKRRSRKQRNFLKFEIPNLLIPIRTLSNLDKRLVDGRS